MWQTFQPVQLSPGGVVAMEGKGLCSWRARVRVGLLLLVCGMVDPSTVNSMGVVGMSARGGLIMRLRGGAKFEENAQAIDMIQLPRNKKGAKVPRKPPPSPIEVEMAEFLFGLQSTEGLRILKYLHVVSVSEIPIGESGERALVMMLPYVEMAEYRKIGPILMPKLEDKFKAHIIWIRHRRILPREKPGKRLQKQKRPKSRSMTTVHNAYLEDIVHPHLVVGRRKIYEVGVKLPMHVVFLDPLVRDKTEGKMEMYRVVYKALTGRKAMFDYYDIPEGDELDKQRCPNIVPTDSAGFAKKILKPPPVRRHRPPPLADNGAPGPHFMDDEDGEEHTEGHEMPEGEEEREDRDEEEEQEDDVAHERNDAWNEEGTARPTSIEVLAT